MLPGMIRYSYDHRVFNYERYYWRGDGLNEVLLGYSYVFVL